MMDERVEMPENLRPSKKVLGMPVYSVQEGQNLGQVKSLVIDAQGKCLLALVVEKRRLTKEEKLLPFSAVKSVGEDVVTVERGQALERRGLDQAVMRALRRPVQPLGARCFTAGGRTMGKVEEYYFAVEDGRIAQLEISDGGLFKGKMLVDGQHIIALAPHTVMLDDAAFTSCRPLENNLLSSMEQARDKAVSGLASSLSRIRGATAAEAGEEEAAEPIDVLPPSEPAPELPPALSVAEETSNLQVEVLTPEEAQAEPGRSVQVELPQLLLVQPEEPPAAPEITAEAAPAAPEEAAAAAPAQ